LSHRPTTHDCKLHTLLRPTPRHLPLTAWIAIATALFAFSGCSRSNLTYSGDAISGRVVEVGSNVPLSGVNVVSAWRLVAGPGHSIVGYIAISEVVTDADGRFHFPEWGPSSNFNDGGVPATAPVILFFKSGYVSKIMENNYTIGTWRPPLHMLSDINGKSIDLERFSGSSADYAKTFYFVETELANLLRNNQCNWKLIPKFLWATNVQHYVLRTQGEEALYSLDYLDRADVNNRSRCGSLQRYVEEHGK